LVIKADDTGKKANKENKETLKDIFEHYHPDAKLNEKEFKEREKEKKKGCQKSES